MFISLRREKVDFLIVHLWYAKSYTWHVGNGELDDNILTTFMKQVQQSEVIFFLKYLVIIQNETERHDSIESI